ncbi:hypothetical protein FHETE_3673 [Fusarium heterosporum]|uniref:Uncharacterized protein n=1 Tax=Fusarium heterosporum TaxID=42747 RepID=A0A8H5TNZ2_FUSHE|nr:hypothetical protein FHETE_3673 [Fusarium heterosporum]
MDLLCGVGGSCTSTSRDRNATRRDSSISLEDAPYKRCTPEPTRSSLPPFEIESFQEQHDTTLGHGSSLPAPSLGSSSSIVAPLEVYLRCDESHESRMVRLGGTILNQDRQYSEPRTIPPSPETSSWEFVFDPFRLSEEVPGTPLLRPELSPKTTAIQSIKTTDLNAKTSDELSLRSDSDMSELSLPIALRAGGNGCNVCKDTAAEYQATKRPKRTMDKTPKMKTWDHKGEREVAGE